jgi:hypothetical protein
VTRLLAAGISVCADTGLGVDRDGVKNYRDIALFLARNLTKGVTDRALAVKVGAWAIDALQSYPFSSSARTTFWSWS